MARRAGPAVIEAELIARVIDPAAVRSRLERLAAAESSTCRDTYYDLPGHPLTTAGRQVRLRATEAAGGLRRASLSYQEPASRPGRPPAEHETVVADDAVIDLVLRAAGMQPRVEFGMHRVNYRFTTRDRDMLATAVTIPEIDAACLELRTPVGGGDLDAGLVEVRAVLGDLGISAGDLTQETYAEEVLRTRG
jgi:adenylate cyclase, class 2